MLIRGLSSRRTTNGKKKEERKDQGRKSYSKKEERERERNEIGDLPNKMALDLAGHRQLGGMRAYIADHLLAVRFRVSAVDV